MTQPFTPPARSAPPAPPAGSSPPTLGAAEPTQEDRMMAAASYLGYLVGFWLVVPIVIYVLKREKSRFVAFHSLQAIIVHALAIPMFIFGWLFAVAVTVGIGLAAHPHRGNSDAMGVLMVITYVGGLLVPSMIYLALSIVCAVRAMQGRVARFPIAAWLTDRFLAGDKGVAQS